MHEGTRCGNASGSRVTEKLPGRKRGTRTGASQKRSADGKTQNAKRPFQNAALL